MTVAEEHQIVEEVFLLWEEVNDGNRKNKTSGRQQARPNDRGRRDFFLAGAQPSIPRMGPTRALMLEVERESQEREGIQYQSTGSGVGRDRPEGHEKCKNVRRC